MPLNTFLGEFSWSPPGWLRRIGLRRAAWSLLASVALAVVVAGGVVIYQGLPQPLRTVVVIDPPGVTPIINGDLVPEPLRLDFAYAADALPPDPPRLSAARLELVDQILEQGVELRPAVPGQWRFETDNRLVFKPAEDWPAGRRYQVRLDPDLFAPSVKLAEHDVTFTTPAFDASVVEATFYQHPEVAAERRVVVGLAFSHPVGRADLARRLHLSTAEGGQNSRSEALGLRVEYGPHDRTAHIHSDIIAIPEREHFAAFGVSAGLRPASGDGVFETPLSAEVRIPDRATYFRVERLKAMIVNDPEERPFQTAIINFTDQVNTEQFTQQVEAWSLPVDHQVGNVRRSHYRWQSPREVTPVVLARSTPLELNVTATQRAAATLQSLTFDAPPGRYVYLRIRAGLTSDGGFVLASVHDDVVRAPDYPRQASIAQDGALLPLTGNRRLTLAGRGVAAIRVEVQQLLPGSINHLASQTGGDITNPWFRSYGFNTDNVSSLTTQIVDLNPGHPREQVFATLDLDPYLDAARTGVRGGVFIVAVQGWDAERERVVGRPDRRMALVTDLGLLVKTNVAGSQHVFVHSITTGEPVANADVKLLGKNGLAVRSAKTDSRGHAHLGSARDFERGQQPAVFIVRDGDDLAFMPYERPDRRLTWSGFDVGGEHAAEDDAERLKAALYTDRGLYRPGEAVQLFGIIRRGDFGTVPDAPIELRIRDARGTTALRRRISLPADGLLTLTFPTRPESPTGQYRADVYLVAEHGRLQGLGGTPFSVEDYQPDRLRIRATIEESAGETPPAGGRQRQWLAPGSHFARVELENLFGTPAQGRRVRAKLVLRPASPSFAEHPGYLFTDPFRDPDTTRRSTTLDLAETVTDVTGVARLAFDVSQYDNGIYRLLLTVEGFEAGAGRSVTAATGKLMSQATALVGYKADGQLDFLARDARRTVSFRAIDPSLLPIAMPDLQAVVVERRFVSALVKQPNGTYGYQSVVKEDEIHRAPFAVSADGADYVLPSAQPGRYALELIDANGLKLSRVEFTVAGASNLAGNIERDAELDLKLDAQRYSAGDEIVMEMTAPYTGTALITIERDRVYAFEWLRAETTTSLARIRVPSDLEGNAYVNVAFVRDIDSPAIFVSPLSYAVAPFAVDRAARRIDVTLEAPPRMLPGDELRLRYATSVPSRLVLFAVDEGILRVAKYTTPAPLDTFLRKRALQVATHQMVDLILPDYAVVRRTAAPGGGDLARLLGANLNPFQRRTEPPAVFWLGVQTAGPQAREASVRIPDHFNGELRVMAVAVAEAKLGAGAMPVTVRGPIVLTPNLALAVAPNDLFDLSVGVANHADDSGADAEVTLAAVDLDGLEIIGNTTVTLAIAEGGEGRATFRARAGSSPGAATLSLDARVGDANVQRSVSLSVRPAVPFETTVATGFDTGTARLDLPRRLHESFANRRIAASASPLVLADGLLEYLDRFPHACTEQLVSKAFPQLGLLRSPGFGLDRAAYGALFTATVARLRTRQDADGGFRFWPTSAEPAPFASVYIAHFLTDARELGIAVPTDMLSRARDYLQRLAADTAKQPIADRAVAATRTRAYAIYVLTRLGSVTTNYLNSLQAALEGGADDSWRTHVTAAYMAASHALLRNEVLAEELIASYRIGESPHPDTDFDTRLGRDAQYAYLLARHFPARLTRLDGQDVRQLVAPIFENRFNTLSAAYTVLALGEMHQALEEQGALTTPRLAASAGGEPIDIDVTTGAFARATLPVNVDAVAIADVADHGVYFVASESGFDANVPEGRLAEGIEVDRVYLDGDGDAVDRVTVGDELTVRLRVRSQRGWLGNVAVTDLIPGGFEIVTASLRNQYGDRPLGYRDVREDRLVLYGTYGPGVTEIRYRVKATSPGQFTAPAAHAQAMYQRSVRGHSAPGRLIVEGA